MIDTYRKKKRRKRDILAAVISSFGYMNEHPEKPQVQRVNAILELLAAIQIEKRPGPLSDLLERLQEAFHRYRWIREILFTTEGPHEWAHAAKQQSEDDQWEYGAVHILLTIAEYFPGNLSKIRRCDVCRGWMFAAKSDHRFCSGKCRQYEYDNDEERRTKKLATMRENYANANGRDKRNKERIGYVNPRKKGDRKPR